MILGTGQYYREGFVTKLNEKIYNLTGNGFEGDLGEIVSQIS
jgi:hypothetical protein